MQRAQFLSGVVRTRPTKLKGNAGGDDGEEAHRLPTLAEAAADNFVTVPGTQSIWMKTYGCAHNVSDGEYMQGILSSYGYRFAETKEDADVWFLNSCTVKDPSESAFISLVDTAKKSNKRVVVSGCVPQGEQGHKKLSGGRIVGVSQLDRVVEVVEETIKGNTVRLLKKNRLPRLDLPKIRKNPFVEIVPLSTGCLGACTYCKTRHARESSAATLSKPSQSASATSSAKASPRYGCRPKTRARGVLIWVWACLICLAQLQRCCPKIRA